MGKCIKCKQEISDNSMYCNWCGKKQSITKRKGRRRANSQGSVYKLSGNRTKQWVAVLPCRYNKKGKPVRTILGYYTSKTDALNALNSAISSNVVNDRINMTLKECYDEWSETYFKKIGHKRQNQYNCVWGKMFPLYNKKIKDIRANDIQNIFNEIEKGGKGLSMCSDMKVLYGLLCRYAMSLGIIFQDYSKFLQLPKYKKKEKKVFPPEQVSKIYEIAESGNETAMIISILIYTGFRINELFNIKREQVNIEDAYMIGGEKTDAGKDRIIPFHDKIVKFVTHFYDKGNEYLISSKTGKRMQYNNFRNLEFNPFCESIGISNITLHCTRHTFATLGQAAGIKPEDMIKLIGHTDYSMTTENYIHQNLETLRKAINKI